MVVAAVVHQHTNNFGDDVAGVALVQGLLDEHGVQQVDVFYIWHRRGGGLPIVDGRVRHHRLDVLAGRKDYRPRLAVLSALSMLSPRLMRGDLRTLLRTCRSADVVFVAPAGSNIGIYKDWTYLLSLAVLVRSGVRLVFCQNTVAASKSRIFDAVARGVLRRSTMYVRESRSQKYLESLGIPSTLGVDTALRLTPPEVESGDVARHLSVVPTRLGTWHRDHRAFDDEHFLGVVLPEGIASFAVERGLDVHVLAHLYGSEGEDDALELVRHGLEAAGCTVRTVRPTGYEAYWKDLAQAEVVVSMRYHGLVLSGAAAVPCVSLSYENKMREAAAYLGMEALLLDVSQATSAQVDDRLREALGPGGPTRAALKAVAVSLREVAWRPLDMIPRGGAELRSTPESAGQHT